MGEKPVVDDRGLITVAPDRMPRPGGCILDHRNLEALLDKLAQMRLDAHVRQHAAEDDPIDPALAQLQDQIVGLRAEHLMRTDNYCLPVVDVGLEAIQPIRPSLRSRSDSTVPSV